MNPEQIPTPNTTPANPEGPQGATPIPPAAFVAQTIPPVNQAETRGSVPGTGFAITGFILAVLSLVLNIVILGIPALLGLIFSIIGRVKTKRAGKASKLALAGIIISIICIILTIIYFGLIVMLGFQTAAKCDELVNGSFTVAEKTVTCVNGKIIR